MSHGWRRDDGDALILTLHVQPGARRTEIAGTHGEALKIRVKAPPAEGKANTELVRYLASAFGVPVRQVTLVRGDSSRHKILRIERPSLRPDHDW